MIRRVKFITRAMVRVEPHVLFVFGDNLQRAGFGGQAREMRGEPNAVGIPTKKAPSMRPEAFFTDSLGDIEVWAASASADFRRLFGHVSKGGTIVLPADGIGTGLADLERRAPEIWRAIQVLLRCLEVLG